MSNTHLITTYNPPNHKAFTADDILSDGLKSIKNLPGWLSWGCCESTELMLHICIAYEVIREYIQCKVKITRIYFPFEKPEDRNIYYIHFFCGDSNMSSTIRNLLDKKIYCGYMSENEDPSCFTLDMYERFVNIFTISIL